MNSTRQLTPAVHGWSSFAGDYRCLTVPVHVNKYIYFDFLKAMDALKMSNKTGMNRQFAAHENICLMVQKKLFSTL
jgi:hypothetical protein